jgi:high-affinity nickel-transport protein
MNLVALLALGFFIGMRHATDADHVMAVTTIVSSRRTLRAALPVGVLWGVGHSATILMVGGAIVVCGVVIPPRIGLGMELSVAFMLMVLGAMNVWAFVRDAGTLLHSHGVRPGSAESQGALSLRPLVMGLVHGLAGSAAVALLVLAAVRDAAWALAYLFAFSAGTVAGMLVITMALAVPLVAAAARFGRLHRSLGVTTGLASVALGVLLAYRVGFVHGLFTGHPQWTPQ